MSLFKLGKWRLYVATAGLLLANTLSLFNFAAANAIAGDTEPWQTSTNTLPDARLSAASVTVNGYVYEIGGQASDNNPSSTVYKSHLNTDGSIGAWTTETSLPEPIYQFSAVAANNYIYVFGGLRSDHYPNTNLYYTHVSADGSLDGWNTTTLPNPRIVANVIVVNNYVYVVGGADPATFDATPYTYYAQLNGDGTLGTWNVSPNLLPDQSLYANIVTRNNYIYVIGGLNNATALSPVPSVYYTHVNTDGTIDPWSTSSNSLPYTLLGSTSVEFNGYLYVMNGSTNLGGAGSTNTVLFSKINNDGSIGSWNTSSNLVPNNIAGATSVLQNGYAYIIGGGSPNSDPSSPALNSVYYASLSPTTIDAPTGLTATTPTNMKPALSWNAVVGATSYKIYRNGTQVGTSTSPSFTDSALTVNASYTYTVTALNGSLESTPSSPFTVIYDTTPPTTTKPTMSGGIHLPLLGFVYITNTTHITTHVADSLSGVVSAEYYFDGDPGHGHGTALTISGGTATATASLSSLSLGQHTLHVRALDAAGNWNAPSNFTFTKAL